jgi:hypothetical protein
MLGPELAPCAATAAEAWTRERGSRRGRPQLEGGALRVNDGTFKDTHGC